MQTENYQRFLQKLPILAKDPKGLRHAFDQKFTTTIGGTFLIEKDFFEGYLLDFLNKKISYLLQSDPRMDKIFEELLEKIDLSKLSFEEKKACLQAQGKWIDSSCEENILIEIEKELFSKNSTETIPLPSLLNPFPPILEDSKKEASLKILKALFSSSTHQNEASFYELFEWILSFDPSLETLEHPIKEVLKSKKRIETTKSAQEILLLSEEEAKEIENLQVNESKMVWVETTGKKGRLLEALYEMIQTNNLLPNDLDFSSAIEASLEPFMNEVMTLETQQKLGVILSGNLAKIFTKENPCNLKEKITNYLSSLILGQIDHEVLSLQNKLDSQTFEDLKKALQEKKLQSFISQELKNLENQLLQEVESAVNLDRFIPSSAASFLEILNIEPRESPQSFCLSFQRQENGKFSLKVFSAGNATDFLPFIKKEKKEGCQIVTLYEDIDASHLDLQFFYSLHSHQIFPKIEKDSRFLMEHFQERILKSLQVEKKEVPSDESSYFSFQAKAYPSILGTLYSFLYHHANFTQEREEKLLFDLKLKALLHLDLKNISNQEKNYIRRFLEESFALYQEGKIEPKLFERIYATFESSLKTTSQSIEEKTTLLPSSMLKSLQNLLEKIPVSQISRIEQFLISCFGIKMQEAIEKLHQAFPLQFREKEQPSFASYQKIVTEKIFHILFGISLQELAQPTLFTYIKVVRTTSQIAFYLLDPTSRLRLISMIAYIALKPALFYFMPESMREFEQKKQEWILYLTAQILVPAHYKEEMTQVISEWLDFLSNKKRYDYQRIDAKELPKEIENLRIHSFRFEETNNLQTSYLPKIPEIFLKEKEPEAIEEKIRFWVENVETIGSNQSLSCYLYLKEKIKSLPTPLSSTDNDLWLNATNPWHLLEEIDHLLISFSHLTSFLSRTSIDRKEDILLFFKLYAIIDKLARRCPNTKLDGFYPNGMPLANWHKELDFQLLSSELKKEFLSLKSYFQVLDQEDWELPLFFNTPLSVPSRLDRILFFSKSKIFDEQEIDPAFYAYIDQWIDDPQVFSLFSDEEKNLTKENKIPLFQEDPKNYDLKLPIKQNQENQRHLLPKAFFLLRRANLIAHQEIASLSKNSFSFGFGLQGDRFGWAQHDNPLKGIKKIMPFLPDRLLNLELVTFHPIARNVNAAESNSEKLWTSKKHSNVKTIEWFFLHPRRKQEKILNHPFDFKEKRFPEENTLFEMLDSLFEEPSKSFLPFLPQQEKTTLELILSDQEEMLPRLISYSLERLEILNQVDAIETFSLFLLQGNVAADYLQKNPDFAIPLQKFFEKAISFYAPTKPDKALTLTKTALLLKQSIPSHLLSENHFFFHLQEKVILPLLEKDKRKATECLALDWLMKEPTEKEFLNFYKDLILIYKNILRIEKYSTGHQDLERLYQNLIWKWRILLTKRFEEDKDFLCNQMLESLLEEKNKLDYKWQGTFPHFFNESIFLRIDELESPTFLTNAKNIADDFINTLFFIEKPNLPILIDEKEKQSFSLFMMYKEKRYDFVKKDSPNSWWRSKDDLLIFNPKQEVIETILLNPTNEGASSLFELIKDPIIIQGNRSEEVKLNLYPHLPFSSLLWFLPYNQMKIYRSIEEKDKITAIEFPKLSLRFFIKNNIAHGEKEFLGWQITEKKLPILSYFPRALVLKNEKEDYQILLPKTMLSSSLTNFITTRFSNFFLPKMLDLGIDRSLKNQKEEIYAYSLSMEGNLESKDPNALLLLLVHYLSHEAFEKANHTLKQILSIGNRSSFPEDFIKKIQALSVGFLLLQDPYTNKMTLQLLSILEENEKIQQEKVSENSHNEELVNYIALHQHLDFYIQRKKVLPDSTIHEIEELQLIEKLIKKSEKFVQKLSQILPLNTSFQEHFTTIVSILTEIFFLSPAISQRYYELKETYGTKKEKKELVERALLKSILEGTLSPNSLENLNQLIPKDLISTSFYTPIFAPKKEKSLLSEILSYTKSSLKPVKILQTDDIDYLQKHSHLQQEEDLKTNFTALDEKEIEENLLGYYEMVWKSSHISIPKTSSFENKKKELKRSLNLIQIEKIKNSSLRAWLLFLKEALELEYAYLCLPEPSFVFNTKEIEELIKTFEKKLSYGKKKNWLLDGEWIPHVMPYLPALAKKAFPLFGLSAPVSLPKIPIMQVPLQINSLISAGTSFKRSYDAILRGEKKSKKTFSNLALQEIDLAKMEAFEEKLRDQLIAIVEKEFDLISLPKEKEAIPPFDSFSNDALILDYFGRLNQSLIDFVENQKEKITLRPKQEKDLGLAEKKLSNNLWKLHLAIKKRKKALEEKLIQNFHQSIIPENPKEIISYNIATLSEKSTPKSKKEILQEIITTFGKNLWQKKWPNLDETKISSLETMIFHYLIYSTKESQLERIFQMLSSSKKSLDLEKELFLEQLAKEFYRKRAYAFNDGLWTRSCLIFEHGSKAMLWEKQAKQLKEMLLGPYDRAVLELITGSGKTFVGIPMIDYFGQEKKWIYNLFPAPIAEMSIDQTAKTSLQTFDQQAHAVSITKNKKLGVEELKALRYSYLKALEKKEHFNGRKTDLQTLELRFIEECYKKKQEKSKKRDETILAYQEVLKLIRLHAKANLDEVHLHVKENEELNYPLGKKRTIKEYSQTILRFVLEMTAKENPTTDFLAKNMIEWKEFSVLEEQKEDFYMYLTDPTVTPPSFLTHHPNFEQICLARGLLLDLFPAISSQKLFSQYGPSKKDPLKEFAIPYDANESPIENAIIENPIEALFKTGVMFISIGLNLDQLTKLAKKLQSILHEELKTSISIERTTIYQTFLAITKDPEFFEKFLKDPISMWNQSDQNPSFQKELSLLYVSLFVVPKITYFPLKLRSNSLNFVSMFSSFFGETATPHREGSFPSGTKILWDPGTSGDFVELVLRLADEKSLQFIASKKPTEHLEEVIDLVRKEPSVSAIIDVSALFTGIRSIDVARIILEKTSSDRPDCKGVVFFDDNGLKMVLERGEKKAIPLEKSRLKIEERIVYYDQARTTGTDIAQGISKKGIVTIDTLGNFATFTKVMQAAGRMRGLRSLGQGLLWVLPEHLKSEIRDAKELLAFTLKNEVGSLGSLNYLGKIYFDNAKKMIQDAVRRAVLDAMLFAESSEELFDYFEEFEEILIQKVEIDPISMYGQAIEKVNPSFYIQNEKEKYQKLIDNTSFSKELKKRCKEKLLEISSQEFLTKIPLMEIKKSIEIGAQQELEIEIEEEVDEQVEEQIEQQVEQQVDQHNVSSLQWTDFFTLREKEAIWPEGNFFDARYWMQLIQPHPLRDSDHEKVEIYPISSFFKEKAPDLSRYSGARLLWTNNQIGIGKENNLYTPFPTLRKPIFELLLISFKNDREKGKIYSVALDVDEAKEWKKRIALNQATSKRSDSVRLALLDLGTLHLLYTGKEAISFQELEENPQFRKDLLTWKLLASRANFLQFIPQEKKPLWNQSAEEWVKECGGKGFLEEFFHDLHQNAPQVVQKGSDFELLFQKDLLPSHLINL